MIIISSINKLSGLSKEEADFIQKTKNTDELVVLVDTATIPIEVTKTLCSSGNKISFIEKANDEFGLGYAVGCICGKCNGKNPVVILLEREISVDNPNVQIGIKKGRSKSSVHKAGVEHEPVRRKKTVTDEPLPVQQDRKTDALRNLILSTKNKTLRELVSDDGKYETLLDAVCSSSDPDIGLEMLLNVKFGKETCRLILTDVKPFYKKIKESR